jgi:uracil-DNA glycosylase
VSSVKDIVNRGGYLTTSVKCGKTGYGVRTDTIRKRSLLLEKELLLFPKAKVLMLMGDVAIKALNCVAQRLGEKRVIPAGSTTNFAARSARKYFFRSMRVSPLTYKPARVSSSRSASEGWWPKTPLPHYAWWPERRYHVA